MEWGTIITWSNMKQYWIFHFYMYCIYLCIYSGYGLGQWEMMLLPSSLIGWSHAKNDPWRLLWYCPCYHILMWILNPAKHFLTAVSIFELWSCVWGNFHGQYGWHLSLDMWNLSVILICVTYVCKGSWVIIALGNDLWPTGVLILANADFSKIVIKILKFSFLQEDAFESICKLLAFLFWSQRASAACVLGTAKNCKTYW